MQSWTTWDSIIHFAFSLSTTDRIEFYIVLSAVSLSLWKHRNEICFTACDFNTARTLILRIKSLCFYWIGTMTKKIKDVVGAWLSVIEDVIPLNQYMPTEL